MQSPLTTYRKDQGLTLEAFAAKFGAHKTTVMRWEGARVPVDRLVEVERVTGIPREKLRPDLFEAA